MPLMIYSHLSVDFVVSSFFRLGDYFYRQMQILDTLKVRQVEIRHRGLVSALIPKNVHVCSFE